MSSRFAFQIESTREFALLEQQAAAEISEYEVGAPSPLQATLPPALVEARFIEPVTFTITATLSLLAVRIVNSWLKRLEGGLQIDLRTSPPTISQLMNIPAGVIVLIDRQGKPTLHRERYEKPEDLLPTLATMLGGSEARK